MKKVLSIIIIILVLVSYIVYFNYKNTSTVIVFQRDLLASKMVSKNVLFFDKLFLVENGIKIMTYNIHHGVGLDDNLDLDRIVNIIRDSGADIIGLNEVDKGMVRTKFQDQVELLANKLGMNYVFGPTFMMGISSYGNAILTTFQIEEATNFRLPGRLSSEPRRILSTRIILPDQSYLYILTTHLSLHKKERQEQLAWIEGYIKTLRESFILMGDFNTELDSFMGSKSILKDIKTYPAGKAKKEIDLCFSSNDLKLINGYTIVSKASDHLPVVIEFKPST